MELKERLKNGLIHSRWFVDKLLTEITTDEDWLKTPVVGSNHTMWIIGHLAICDNFFIARVNPEKSIPNDDFIRLFGKGSQPTYNVSDYPPKEKVLEYFNERRSAFLDLLEECSDEDFDRATPEGSPAFMPNVGAVFQMSVWHESLHTGQLTLIHRMLGQKPVADRPKN